MDTKIIILTPIKNEEWILEQFLAVSSLFADCIIIADQQSTDSSRKICSKFPKVNLIDNPNTEYDEADRQILLIGTARKLFPDHKRILFCLDCDELFSADSLTLTETWNRIKNFEIGTSIYMEKPDILHGLKKCVRWRDNYFAVGYVDDGIQHVPTTIHSKRIPDNRNGETVYVDDIKILHFAHTRINSQSAKMRYYSVIENINSTKPFYLRRFAYNSFYNEELDNPSSNIELTPDEWLNGWDNRNINLRNLPDPQFSWHDFNVLNLFKRYGYEKFHPDDIWEFDWEGCRIFGKEKSMSVPDEPVVKPSWGLTILLKGVDVLYLFYRKLKYK